MNITLYQNHSPSNALAKQLTTVASYDGTLRSPSSLLDPIVMLQMDPSTKFNYAYIPEFNRYYFVKNIVATSNNLVTISMHVDVLMSYAGGIRRMQAVVARNEIDYNLYLDDGMYKVQQNPKLKRITFPNVGEFGKFSYVFTIGGNGNYVPPEPPGPDPIIKTFTFEQGGITAEGAKVASANAARSNVALYVGAREYTISVSTTQTASLPLRFAVKYYKASAISAANFVSPEQYVSVPTTYTCPGDYYVGVTSSYDNATAVDYSKVSGYVSFYE